MVVNHGNNKSTQTEIKGLPFTLSAVFYNNNVPTQVSNPKIKLLAADSGQTVGFSCIDSFPLQPDKTEWELNLVATTTAYQVTIDPLSLPIGLYRAVFQGEMVVGSKTIVAEILGTIGLGELSRADRLASTALAQLMDDPGEYLFRPQIHMFKASNLFKYMEKGIHHLNLYGSPAMEFDINTLPEDYEAIIVDYIIAMSLFGKARLAIENDVTINDSRSISTDHHNKYMSMYTTLMAEINDKIKAAKATSRPGPYGHKRHRYPYFMARMISMLPNYKNSFSSYGYYL